MAKACGLPLAMCRELMWEGYSLRLIYQVGTQGYGRERLRLNGQELLFTRLTNPYRKAGVSVDMATFRAGMQTGE